MVLKSVCIMMQKMLPFLSNVIMTGVYDLGFFFIVLCNKSQVYSYLAYVFSYSIKGLCLAFIYCLTNAIQ